MYKQTARNTTMSLLFEWYPKSTVHVSDDYSHDDDPILHDWFLNNFEKISDVQNM